jgi:hypothetical protein
MTDTNQSEQHREPKRVAVGACLLLFPLVAACGQGSDTTPEAHETVTVTASGDPTNSGEPTNGSSPQQSPWETAVRFTEAVSKYHYAVARSVTAPGSDAARYLQAQAAQHQAVVMNGGGFGSYRIAIDEDEQRIAVYSPLRPAKPASVFENFQYDDNGRITGLSTGAGDSAPLPVGPRLWTQPASTLVQGTRWTLRSAFESKVGLFIVLAIRTGDVGIQPGFTANYKDGRGRQFESGQSTTPEHVQRNAVALAEYVIPRAQLGGVVQIEFWPSGGHGVARLPIR